MDVVVVALKTDNPMPKVQPIKSLEIPKGNAGRGTIKQINSGEGRTCKYVKHKVDSISKEVKTADGGFVCKNISYHHTKISVELKIPAAAEGGSVKNISKHHTKTSKEAKRTDSKHHTKTSKEAKRTDSKNHTKRGCVCKNIKYHI